MDAKGNLQDNYSHYKLYQGDTHDCEGKPLIKNKIDPNDHNALLREALIYRKNYQAQVHDPESQGLLNNPSTLFSNPIKLVIIIGCMLIWCIIIFTVLKLK